MLLSSSCFPTYRRCSTLRLFILKLRFSSQAAQRCQYPFSEIFIPESDHTVRALSDFLSSGRYLDVLSLLRRVPPSRSLVFYWNVIIKWNVSSRNNWDVLRILGEMRRLDWAPDGFTYPYVFKASGDLPSLQAGAAVHALALVSGYTDSNVFVNNAAVTMYGKCGAHGRAQNLFDEMLQKGLSDRISWNSIIAVHAQAGNHWRALKMFQEMVSRGDLASRADPVSLVNVLPACASLRSCRSGKEIHGHAVRSNLIEDLFVGNAVIDMYAKCGLLDEAKNVFERMSAKDVVSWNALVTGYSQVGKFDTTLGLFDRMREDGIELNVVTWSAVIAAYAQRGLGREAIEVFREMVLSGSKPNTVTFVSLLSACAACCGLNGGKETHCFILKHFINSEGNEPGDEMMVINGLIDMYAKCKDFKTARTIFDSIGRKDRSVVTWTVLIGGYAQHGEAGESLRLFAEMLAAKACPNGFTVSCALVACAHAGALRIGREIHAHALRTIYEESAALFISNCLIDMYAKSGDADAGRAVFDSMAWRNAVSWTSVMMGYGLHGRGEEALGIFDQMQAAGLPVDEVTMIIVLYACSHSGMIERGMDYFYRMERDFGVVPGVEHYACMVDLLGRAGRLGEAVKLVESMSMEPNSIVWVALLSGCRLHGNVELGELAVSRLLELKFENDGLYTLLSNLYASAKRWKDVARVRLLMKKSGIRKRPGCSWVQGKKGTAVFYVGDKSHPMAKEIYSLLDDLISRVKKMGYVPETVFALHDVDEEEKGELLLEHSEKLALAYGILTTAPGVPIRITKNLRVCGDCHTVITYISRIIEHEIVLRDSSRFHHFKNGACSCRGYW